MKKRSHLPINPEQRNVLLEKIKSEIERLNSQEAQMTSNAQRVKILEERIKLITNMKDYNEDRIKNLQRILKHYSTHVFKPGQRYNFDEIKYINEHMIIERFFAFIIDFKLNEIAINGENKPIVDPKEIVLLFKKCSSNSKNLDLPEFITCLERLFVILFDQNQNYFQKIQNQLLQKLQKRLEARKKEKQRMDRIKSINAAQSILKQGPTANKQPSPSKKKTKEKNRFAKQEKQIEEILKKSESRSTQHMKVSPENEQLYTITDEQKIESYMIRIGIDDRKQIEKKLRYFEKANFHYTEVQELSKFKSQKQKKVEQSKLQQPSDPKKELVSMHSQWNSQRIVKQKDKADRFNNIKQKLKSRQLEQSNLHMSRSLSKDQYEKKSKILNQRYSMRQKSLLDPFALKKLAKNQDESNDYQFYSLEMLHRSSPNQLQIAKIIPDKYIGHDPTDQIFLDEYGFIKPINRKFSINSNAEMIQSTKRRVVEIQTQQSKRLGRLTNNLHQNHHYLSKFLERKW